MGKVQSLPIEHFEATDANWTSDDCILSSPTGSPQVVHNLLTFWLAGAGCDISTTTTISGKQHHLGTKYKLQQCFKNESPIYQRVRMVTADTENRIALLQREPSGKKLVGASPYRIYTYQPRFQGQTAFGDYDNGIPFYLFGEIKPTQWQGFKWEYSIVQSTHERKLLCSIDVRPNGHKFNCRYYNHNSKVCIAESIQKNGRFYNDWGEVSPIKAAKGVDEVALILLATAMEDHRDRMNNGMRGTSASYISKNGYTPPLERTRNPRGFTNGFCS